MKARFVMAAGALALSAAAAFANTSDYCSEGFDPALFTVGTTFDASSQPIYNQPTGMHDRNHRSRARPG